MTANSTKTPEPTDPGNRLCPRDRPRTRHEQHQARHRPREGEVGEDPTKTPKPRQAATVADGNAKPERKPRTDTRQAQLITMLRGKDGATVEEIAGAFGWQAQTVRVALYGL